MGDRSSWLKDFAFLLVSFALTTSSVWADAGEIARVIASNDNTRPAGTTNNRTVRIRLVAAAGDWQPEGPRSPKLRIAAFGEDLDSLVTPSPLLRVTEGSDVIVQITNALTEPLNVHGLLTHPASNDGAITVAPGAMR